MVKIRRLRRQFINEKALMFYFSFGGAGPSSLKPLLENIPPEITPYGVLLPGGDELIDEKPYENIHDLTLDVIGAIKNFMIKPYITLGVSVGAVLSFETLQQIQKQGLPAPVHAYLWSHKAPQYIDPREKMYDLPDEALVKSLAEWGAAPPELLNDPAMLALILPRMRNDFKLAEEYECRDPAGLDARLTACAGSADELIGPGELSGWRVHFTPRGHAAPKVRRWEGGHFFMFDNPGFRDDFERSLRDDVRRVLLKHGKNSPDANISRRMDAIGAARPEDEAVICGDRSLTWRELEKHARHIKNYLLSLTDPDPGRQHVVGILMDKSIEFVLAVYGILKAGYVFLPIETKNPRDLAASIIHETEPLVILTGEAYTSLIPDETPRAVVDDAFLAEIEGLKENDAVYEITPEDTIYLVYSSGTTGRPKGIMVTHKACLNAYEHRYEQIPYTGEDHREGCNIFFIWELLRPLMKGATLCVIPDEVMLDPAAFIRYAIERKITRILFTPSSLKAHLSRLGELKDVLKTIIFCGEVVTGKLLAETMKAAPDARIYNLYSISECHDVSLARLDGTREGEAYASTGRLLPGVRAITMDENMKVLEEGEAGEIFIGGVNIGNGYWNRMDLMADRFVLDPADNRTALYRTGDMGKIVNQEIIVQGRCDFTLRIRGYSVDALVIEERLETHPLVKQALVKGVASPAVEGELILVGWVVLNEEVDCLPLKSFLKESLPEYMIPSIFMKENDALVDVVSGKIQRRDLPDPFESSGRQLKESETAASETATQEALLALWREVLGVRHIGVDESFFEVGGDSLTAIHLVNRIRERLDPDISVTDVYQYPTIEKIAARVDGVEAEEIRMVGPREAGSAEIAVIGMSCRFSGVNDADQFWELLMAGEEAIRTYTDEEMRALGAPGEVIDNPRCIKVGGLIDDVDRFDAEIFGLSPKESMYMDPQHRKFLETAYNALEHAGCNPFECPDNTGVFASCAMPMYIHQTGLADQLGYDDATNLLIELGNDKDYIASRTSYALNLNGPSMTIQTSCSTSLTTVAAACRSLRLGESDMAVAGAASLFYLKRPGYIHHEGMVHSSDGRCRPFDREADGTVFTDGVGVVILKRAADAIRDQDYIHAIIKGDALNNDGSRKENFTAPAAAGQTEVIRRALAGSGVGPGEIGFVETHGTGTYIGDPIEVRALARAYSAEEGGPCILGSVKANVGHANIAAGMASLIKTVLCLDKKMIPGMAHFHRPNPELRLQETRFTINKEPEPMVRPPGGTRKAGVSCFGMGGSNVHMILEEGPRRRGEPEKRGEREERGEKGGSPDGEFHALPFSANDEASLRDILKQTRDHFKAHPDIALNDVQYTLTRGRRRHPHRKIILCKTPAQAVRRIDLALDSLDAGNVNAASRHTPGEVVFAFSGQGSQHAGMGADLCQSNR
ncbi:MAG: AMP-binding protein [Desulfobacterales bacterium]|nr:AMP-binding protein [Desulfobacterales bacterium]